jgi:hypothetical protein
MSSLLATTSTDADESTTNSNGTPAVESGTTQANSGGNSEGVNWEKRYKDLQSYHDREKTRLSQEVKQAQSAGMTVPTTPEEMEAFKKDNAVLYNMMLTVARQESQSSSSEANERIEAVAHTVGATKAQLAKTAILESHPDFATVVNSKDFKVWASAAPQEVQDWIYRNPDNAGLAIAALDRYKAQAGNKNNSKGSSNASAADAISSGSSPDIQGTGKIWKGSEIKKLSPKQYEKYEDDIDTAFTEGRVDMNS